MPPAPRAVRVANGRAMLAVCGLAPNVPERVVRHGVVLKFMHNLLPCHGKVAFAPWPNGVGFMAGNGIGVISDVSWRQL